MRGRVELGLAALLACACSPGRSVDVRIDRGVASRVTEIRSFAYDRRADPSARCEAFEPRGAGPGDAEQRTGKTALQSARRGPGNALGQLQLPNGPITLVVEGWDTSAQILRAHACAEIDLEDARLPAAISMRVDAIEGLQAAIKVVGVPCREAQAVDDPSCPVAAGVTAAGSYVVQLLDADAQRAAGRKVHFAVRGKASLVELSRSSSVAYLTTDAQGRAAVTLRPARDAADDIQVEAYAPGFEGAPLTMHAKALPALRADTETVDLDRRTVDLRPGPSEHRPIVVGDFDGNGRADAAFLAGGLQHRLAVLSGRTASGPSGGYDLAVSAASASGEAHVMLPLRLTPGTVRALVVFSSAPDGSTPLAEAWTRGAAGDWSVAPLSVPLEGGAIHAAAADIDGDGDDDLALIVCKDFSPSNCQGGTLRTTSSQLVVYENVGGRFEQRASLGAASSADGSFREVALADVNGDGGIDVLATLSSKVIGFCGQRGAIGFASNNGFFAQHTYGSSWGIAAIDLNRDGLADIASVAGTREKGPATGVKAFRGCAGCAAHVLDLQRGSVCGLEEKTDPVRAGPRADRSSAEILVTGADLNGDGAADLLVLNRVSPTYYALLGAGTGELAAGPAFPLPAAQVSRFSLGLDLGVPTAVTLAPLANRVLFVRFHAD